MIIEHAEHGKVAGVERDVNDGVWMLEEKSRRTYFCEVDGWAEVQEPRWVDCTAEVEIERGNYAHTYFTHGGVNGIDSDAGYAFQKVDRYALPPLDEFFDQLNRLRQNNAGSYLGMGLREYIESFKQPCLIIQRKENL